MTPTRPLIRYHGGKWRLAPWIISQFPEHRRYIEPFGGAGSVLLRKQRVFTEVWNDLDGDIVNLFRVARDRGDRLSEALALTPFAREEFKGAYADTQDEVERARRTVVRAYMGFGTDGVHSDHVTGFRGRSERSGTSPAHDWANFPPAMRLIFARLQGVVVENMPAVQLIQKYDGPKTLIYADPPYVHETRVRVDFQRGYRHEMDDEAHRALAVSLNACESAVVLSGYHCPLYDELYAGWDRVEKTGPFADGARERTEVLWMRNCGAGRLPGL